MTPPELLHLFDAETGQETDESVLGAQLQAEMKDREECEAIEKMVKTRGWLCVEEHLLKTINDIKESILDEPDMEKIRKYQAVGAAYSNVLGLVSHKASRAKEMREPKTNPEG
jgi:hypothetical protein